MIRSGVTAVNGFIGTFQRFGTPVSGEGIKKPFSCRALENGLRDGYPFSYAGMIQIRCTGYYLSPGFLSGTPLTVYTGNITAGDEKGKLPRSIPPGTMPAGVTHFLHGLLFFTIEGAGS